MENPYLVSGHLKKNMTFMCSKLEPDIWSNILVSGYLGFKAKNWP